MMTLEYAVCNVHVNKLQQLYQVHPLLSVVCFCFCIFLFFCALVSNLNFFIGLFIGLFLRSY